MGRLVRGRSWINSTARNASDDVPEIDLMLALDFHVRPLSLCRARPSTFSHYARRLPRPRECACDLNQDGRQSWVIATKDNEPFSFVGLWEAG